MASEYYGSTYSDAVLLNFTTGDESLTLQPADKISKGPAANSYQWKFDGLQKFTDQKQDLKLLTNDKKTYTTHFSVYRGAHYEATGILSGLITEAGTVLFLGGLSAGAWAENIFKSENSRWSVRRWGARADYFTSFNGATNQFGKSVAFGVLNSSFKYRMKPGVWNHDEVYGPQLSFQYVNFFSSGSQGYMLGLGAFYGARLFSGVDKFLSKLKWLSYPKWMDYEINYYLLPLSTTTTMTLSFDAAAKLKMFIRDNIFVQVAIHARNFSFIDRSPGLNVQTFNLYGTIGGGLNF